MTLSRGIKGNIIPLTAESVKDIFTYDSEEGILRWKVNGMKVRAGQPVGSPDKVGRLRTTYNYKNYLVYHLIWLFVYGRLPEKEIDHIDRNPGNNKLANLRECSHAENLRNAGARTNNKTGHVGIFWDERRGKYLANLMKDGVTHHIGRYHTLEEAVAARKAFADALFGEFAPK